MDWVKHPLTRKVARGLRAATHRKPGLDGHRFFFTDLKELWVSDDEQHVVLTHHEDPVWQHWVLLPEGGWNMVGHHSTLKVAQDIAAHSTATPADITPGTYLLAWMDQGRTIRVKCLTMDGSKVLGSIFERMGYQIAVDKVA